MAFQFGIRVLVVMIVFCKYGNKELGADINITGEKKDRPVHRADRGGHGWLKNLLRLSKRVLLSTGCTGWRAQNSHRQ